jgi:RHS repeat-associated protein
VRLSEGGNILAEDAYDGRNRRAVKKSYSGGALTETRHLYHSEDWQVIEERVEAAMGANRQWVWGLRYLDDLVLRDRDNDLDGSLEERLYCLQVGSWNVTAIADEAGEVQERYLYDAYGTRVILTAAFLPTTSSGFGWETSFGGYRFDSSSGLYSVRNRFYASVLGVFLCRDPFVSRGKPRSLDGFSEYTKPSYRETSPSNLYRYTRNNPIPFTDPFGLFDWGYATIGGIAGAVFATGAVIVTAPVSLPTLVIVGVGAAGGLAGGYLAGEFASSPTQAAAIGAAAGTVVGVACGKLLPVLLPPAVFVGANPQIQQQIAEKQQQYIEAYRSWQAALNSSALTLASTYKDQVDKLAKEIQKLGGSIPVIPPP